MIFNGEYPYDDYRVYVEYHSKENRRYAILRPYDHNKRITSISYARYLMSVKEKRILAHDEEVDHIDNNPMNDDINNLQILSPENNRLKYSSLVHKAMVRLKCPACGKEFIKEKRQVHALYNANLYSACSRECAGRFAASIQYHKLPKEEIARRIRENIIEEFYK